MLTPISRSLSKLLTPSSGFAVAALTCAGCVTSPVSDSMASTNVMTFEGYYSHTSASSVSIYGIEPSNQSLSWLGNASVGADDSWRTTVNVPARFWPSLCAAAAFQVFPKGSNQSIVGINQTCLANLPPNPTSADYAKCRADPILVTLAATYHGNLSISGASQAGQFQCVTEVDGDLTIIGGGVPSSQVYLAGVSVALPNLQRVRGSLSVNTDHAATISLPALTEVGGALNVSLNRFWSVSGNPPTYATLVGQLAAPALTSVGGDIALHALKDSGVSGGSGVAYDFGLDAVTSAGANVLVDQPHLPGTPKGLRNLVSVPGNLTVQQPTADFYDDQLLPLLQSVGGSLTVTTNPFFRYFLPALSTVSGNVTFTGSAGTSTIRDSVAPLLTSVGGNLTLERYRTESCSALGSLTHVGGTFRVDGGGLRGYYGVSTVPGPQFGAIEISGAQGSVIPFYPGVTVNGAGPVGFTNNSELCSCQVADFGAGLATGGWSGALTNTGNGSAVTCGTSCPHTACP
ncbi:MAG TPA: hypothetical protein VG937_37690 [Polyangiaceae bacterium]|nr:hypothetical protein [Polyangiaceae bacterium]